ncbi:hypothetical protein [Pseudonocardia alni]|uniref:Uncharacterized protein n=1 Tax=Pseudonocardia alni TaxID=33907 RepID=A0A852W7J1_PSEA5|nr:hypothetical protein [Pseudonocardia antarctica]NYG05127.1 hypothetical protein [Pseudonocardia antarctica]
MRAEPLDRAAPGRRRLDDADVLHAHAAQREPQADPDRPGAEHQRRVARVHPAELGRVVGHGHGLDERAHLQRHVLRQRVQHVRRDDGGLGHAAVGHQTVEADLRAHVVAALGTA